VRPAVLAAAAVVAPGVCAAFHLRRGRNCELGVVALDRGMFAGCCCDASALFAGALDHGMFAGCCDASGLLAGALDHGMFAGCSDASGLVAGALDRGMFVDGNDVSGSLAGALDRGMFVGCSDVSGLPVGMFGDASGFDAPLACGRISTAQSVQSRPSCCQFSNHGPLHLSM